MKRVDAFPPDLKRVRAGDWDGLITYIEDGGTITDEMRKFLVGVLRGVQKRPNSRPPKIATMRRYKDISERVFNLIHRRGLNTTKAVQKVAEEEGRDPRTIQRMIKSWNDFIGTLPEPTDTNPWEEADI